MKLVSGVDLVEIERFQAAIERYQDRFLNRLFTSLELADAGGSVASLAARFAAKEAVSKALGTGIGPIGWLEIEILRGDAGQPVLHLHGAAARLSSELELQIWSISLSHTRQYAMATATAVG